MPDSVYSYCNIELCICLDRPRDRRGHFTVKGQEARATAARMDEIRPERDRGGSPMWLHPRPAELFLRAERLLGLGT